MDREKYIKFALEVLGIVDYDTQKEVEAELEDVGESELLDELINKLIEMEDYFVFESKK